MARAGDYAHSADQKSSLGWAIVALVSLIAALVATFVWLILLDRGELTHKKLLVDIALAGAAGSSWKGAASIVSFVGHRRFEVKWLPYYLLSPLVGATLAVFISMGAYSLLLTSGVPPSAFNYGGVLVLSFVAGVGSGNVLAELTMTVERVIMLDPNRDKLMDTQLERYHGFLVRHIESSSESSVLEVWLQDEPNEMLPSVEIDSGSGLPARRVTFRVSVYADEGDVSPSIGELIGGTEVFDSPRLQFTFTGSGASAPAASLEVTQQGRTVAIVRIGPTREVSGAEYA